MFYLITVAGGTLLVTFFNFIFAEIHTFRTFGEILLSAVIGVIALFLIDALTAFLARRLPEKWFAPEANLFTVGQSERKLYRKLKINSWKKYVPEWGCFTGFHKDKVREPDSSAYIGRFLIESNYGVAIHIVNALGGFVIGFLPFCGGFWVWMPVAIVNFVLSMLPVFILRNNTPPLLFLYKRATSGK
jgi:hypothetical protein